VASMEAHRGAVLRCAWSQSYPHRIASAAADGSVYIWDARRSGLDACVGQLDHQQQERKATSSSNTSRSSSSSTQGRHLTPDMKARIVARARGRAVDETHTPMGFSFQVQSSHTAHDGAVTSVQFLPGDKASAEMLVTSGSDDAVRLWSNGQGESENHQWSLHSTACGIVSSRHKLGCQPALLALPAGTEVASKANSVSVYVLHPNSCAPTSGVGGAVGTGDATGGVSVMDMSQPEAAINLWGGHIGTVTHVELHETLNRAYTAGQDGSVVCRQLRDQQQEQLEQPLAAAAAWGDLL